MSIAAQLFDLQVVDLEIDGANARLAAIDRALADIEAVAAAGAAAAEADRLLAAARGALIDAELALSQHEAHQAAVQTKLYGGSVHNPKELQNLQQDADSLARQKDHLEVTVLELMEQAEAAQAAAQSAHETLAQAQAESSAAHALLHAEAAGISTRLPSLTGKRSDLAAQVPGSILPIYTALRAQKNGRAVARLEQTMCTGCGVSMSTGEAQHARSAAAYGLAYCTNCGRILYAGH